MMISGQADDRQRQAILADGHQLVSACPGAGKTRVLALRSAYLLTHNPKGRIVAVTFTRDAAKSLRQRILEQSGAEFRGRVASGTFHALALSQLKRGRATHGFRILSPGEQDMFMRQAWERTCARAEFSFDDFDDARASIEAIKASMDEPPDAKTTPQGAVYQTYQQLLERAHVCDFADLMLRSVQEMGAGTLKPMPVRWMLVDEAQDMDDVQYAWVMAHANAGVEVMCVADDDQSIYQWRHALGYAGLMRFVSDTGARHLTLDINYRCKPEVLEPAVSLINVNSRRVSKNIRAASAPGGEVAVLANDTRWDEVTRLSNHLLDVGASGWGVLGRTNRILDAVELALTSAGMAYQRIGGGRFWDKPAAQAYMGLIKAVASGDAVALLQSLRWAGLFRDEGIEPATGETAAQLLERLAQHKQGDSPTAAQRSARTLIALHANG